MIANKQTNGGNKCELHKTAAPRWRTRQPVKMMKETKRNADVNGEKESPLTAEVLS
jgi:hypothetical protein